MKKILREKLQTNFTRLQNGQIRSTRTNEVCSLLGIKKLCAMGLSLLCTVSLMACGNTQQQVNQDPSSDYVDTRDFHEEFLPIGSVVLLDGGNKKVMICGRIQAMAGSDIVYDYSACYYPEGILDPAAMFFFNREDIAEVSFIGYEDQTELDYRQQLESLGELEVRDGTIVEKADN